MSAPEFDVELPDLGALSPQDAAMASKAFWDQALAVARELGPLPQPIHFQGAADPLHSAEEAVARLRDELSKCAIAFQARPAVRELPPVDGYAGWRAWNVDVPLTLFPSRDRGFTVVDVAVQFQPSKPGALQLTKLSPERQTRSLARIHMNTEVSLAASKAAGIPVPPVAGVAMVADVAAALDAGFESAKLEYVVQRTCLDTGILADGRAVWRLDKPENPHALRLDAAMLSVQLVTAPDAGPVTAYGAAIGSTRALWLSASLGSLYGHLRNLFGALFLKRQPIECRVEWPNVLG